MKKRNLMWVKKVLKVSYFWPICPVCSKKVSLPLKGYEKEIIYLPKSLFECFNCHSYFKVETIIIDEEEIRYSTRLVDVGEIYG